MATQQVTIRPKTVNLHLYAGDDVFLDVVVNNTDGTPTDLTGCGVRAQIRTAANATTVAATWTPTIIDNVIHLHLTGAESRVLPPNTVWDCELTTAAGVVSTLAYGSIAMKAEVTR